MKSPKNKVFLRNSIELFVEMLNGTGIQIQLAKIMNSHRNNFQTVF